MAEVRIFKTPSGKEGHDLNDVIRGVLAEIMEARHWSENQAAAAIGLKQRSFNRFMKGQHGLRVQSWSRLCAELEMNPVDFLRAHDLYDKDARAKLRFAKDVMYDRFRTLLGNDDARKLLKLLDEATNLGAFEAVMETVEAAVHAAKSARRKGIRSHQSA